MKQAPMFTAATGSLILVLSLAFFVLPALGLDVFLSPDETANAVSANAIATTGGLKVAYSIVEGAAWAHPRSFVAGSDGLLPVAFVGMPLVLGIAAKIFGSFGMAVLTPLLAISVLFPLWSFTRSWGRMGQLATVVGWMTFPTVILYANRGLFPNLPVVCLAIWSSWLVWRSRSPESLVASGLLAGLALIIRPTEIIWILPWMFTARALGSGRSREIHQNAKDTAVFMATLLIVCMFGAWVGWRTYGAWFTAGYQLRDPIMASVGAGAMESGSSRSWFESWPFGFHPRNVAFNVYSYLIVYLFPWFLVVVSAAALAWKKKGSKHLLILAAWTIIALSILYGQSVYQDHIVVNAVSLANSFLRYLLPVSVIAAASLGWCASRLPEIVRRHGTFLAALLIVLTGVCGAWTAFARDDEGLSRNREELQRYSAIREDAVAHLRPGTVILSDRSDKIFFPVYPAVSPLPSKESIRTLKNESVALYLRTQTQEQLNDWRTEQMELVPLFTAGNESLYSVRFEP